MNELLEMVLSTKIDESTFHDNERTVTSLTANGRLNSP